MKNRVGDYDTDFAHPRGVFRIENVISVVQKGFVTYNYVNQDLRVLDFLRSWIFEDLR